MINSNTATCNSRRTCLRKSPLITSTVPKELWSCCGRRNGELWVSHRYVRYTQGTREWTLTRVELGVGTLRGAWTGASYLTVQVCAFNLLFWLYYWSIAGALSTTNHPCNNKLVIDLASSLEIPAVERTCGFSWQVHALALLLISAHRLHDWSSGMRQSFIFLPFGHSIDTY